MSSDDQTARLLSELDLSEYETRAYLSVLEGGIMVARDISDRASIPYAKVYQTLNDLIDKQLITGDEGRPKKFQPRNPKEAIHDRLATMERTWKQSHERRKKLLDSILPELQSLYEATDISIEDEQGVWNISGATNISSRLSKLAELATDTILVVTSSVATLEEHFLKSLQDYSSVPLVLVTNTEVKSPPYSQVYTHTQVGSAIVIIFDKMAMMSIAEIEKGRFSAGEFTGVLTRINALVESALINYEVLMR